MNDNKFTTGLLLGLILGGGAVFLLGTRTGKNLLKIVSDQGLDGLVNLLEEYGLDSLEEIEEVEEVAKHRNKMPHKSTYFYPKLLTGLVIHKF